LSLLSKHFQLQQTVFPTRYKYLAQLAIPEGVMTGHKPQ
jgi:hypothetical protein